MWSNVFCGFYKLFNLVFPFLAHVDNEVFLSQALDRLGANAMTKDHEPDIGMINLHKYMYVFCLLEVKIWTNSEIFQIINHVLEIISFLFVYLLDIFFRYIVIFFSTFKLYIK